MPSLMSPELPTLRRNTSITPRKAAYRAHCRLPCTTRDNHRLIRGKPSLRHLSIKGDDIPRVDYFTVKNPCHVIIFRLAGIAFVLHHSSRSPLMPAARGNQRIILTSPWSAAVPGRGDERERTLHSSLVRAGRSPRVFRAWRHQRHGIRTDRNRRCRSLRLQMLLSLFPALNKNNPFFLRQ